MGKKKFDQNEAPMAAAPEDPGVLRTAVRMVVRSSIRLMIQGGALLLLAETFDFVQAWFFWGFSASLQVILIFALRADFRRGVSWRLVPQNFFFDCNSIY